VGVNGFALRDVPIIGQETVTIERWFVTAQIVGRCIDNAKHTLLFAGLIGQTTVCAQCCKVYTLLSLNSHPKTGDIGFEFGIGMVAEKGGASGAEAH